MKQVLGAGKYMLAHAASAQGISAVENMCGREHVLDHNSVPAACFTHPEVSPMPHSAPSPPALLCHSTAYTAALCCCCAMLCANHQYGP